MDRREPGGGSSSQSADPGPSPGAGGSISVVSLEFSGADAERLTIHLSDGSSMSCPAEIAGRAGLSPGATLDADRLALLRREAEFALARASALRLLSRASHSRRGLARKLQARGYGPEAIRAALARMGELGYLDDRLFAENWARARLASKAEGWSAIYRGLVKRGVPRRLAEEAASVACSADRELELAQKIALGLAPRTAAARLSARGFRARTIARVIREMRARQDEEA